MIIDTHRWELESSRNVEKTLLLWKNESIEQLKETNLVQITLNQEIEELYEQGKISFESFNWWLQWICGI